MLDYLNNMLGKTGLPPHGFCLFWDEELVWTHVIADLVIGLSYFSIPVVLGLFVVKRRDLDFGWVAWLFVAFILACGATHFFSILTLWVPAYGVQGLLKLATAAVSLLTAVALWPLLPRALALPAPAQLRAANEALTARIVERDLALAALNHEIAERSRVEELLRQSQKMEAIGQLTGGIAHDFNNLLTIVMTNLDRAARLTEDARLKRPLAHALEGAERGARLTRQLLAFSRNQPFTPSPQDLNRMIEGMSDLLDRSLGGSIRVVLDLAEALPAVVVDPVQAENALINLAINARDAMPDGGTLTFATSTAAGRVVLTVSDTGIGMPAAVRARALEPFFTTKDVGQGSGLGLAQVYGFTTQSGGEIELESAERVGTQIMITLPAADSGGKAG